MNRRDALSRWRGTDWDEATRATVRERLDQVPPIRFFTAEQARLLDAVFDRLVPQEDRPPRQRIPITPWIDAKLFEDRRDGYRYESLPPQREAWRLGLGGVDETAVALFGASFLALGTGQQDEVLRSIQGSRPPGLTWGHLPAGLFFVHVLLLTAVKAYYAHPSAWKETGYGGPSSPRGHVRTWEGGIDPWEPDTP